jgi:hypothetical protein
MPLPQQQLDRFAATKDQTAVIRESNVIASGRTNAPAISLVLPQGETA